MKDIVQWNPVYEPGTARSISYRKSSLVSWATWLPLYLQSYRGSFGRSEREVARRRSAAAYDIMWLSNGSYCTVYTRLTYDLRKTNAGIDNQNLTRCESIRQVCQRLLAAHKKSLETGKENVHVENSVCNRATLRVCKKTCPYTSSCFLNCPRRPPPLSIHRTCLSPANNIVLVVAIAENTKSIGVGSGCVCGGGGGVQAPQ